MDKDLDKIKELIGRSGGNPSDGHRPAGYAMKVKVDIERLYPDVEIPRYQTEGSACVDLRAYRLVSLKNSTGTVIATEKDKFKHITMARGYVAKFGTGIKVKPEDGWAMNVISRSGLACNESLIVVNEPGKADTDYRGEIFVTLCKLYGKPFVINKGDRIAQMEPVPQVKIEFNEVEKLPVDSSRGESGYGHTGLK